MTEVDNEDQKAYEERLRRRLKIFQEKFKEGKIKTAEGLNVKDSLLAVRTGTDGEIDLDTVDGLVRSMALAVTSVFDREELKQSISLSEIQNTYFSFIEQEFGHFYKEMIQNGVTPQEVGKDIIQRQEIVKEINQHLDEFLDVINGFWDQFSDVAHIHVEDMHNKFKGVFGGGLFPSHDENIASKCGIYIDTIILPDPFLRSKIIFQNMNDSSKVFYLVKHALNILQYKDLACADVNPPIVVILPDIAELQHDEKEFFDKMGQQDSLIHMGKLFARKFTSFEELLDFTDNLDTAERVDLAIKDYSCLLFDTEWRGGSVEQIKRFMNEFTKLFETSHPGRGIVSHVSSRMSICNELLTKSQRMGGSIIIEAPTSWQYLVWKMKYDIKNIEKIEELHIVRGLQNLADNEMQWLGKVPTDALIEIRKADALGDIREVLGKGIADLSAANPNDFYRTSEQVFENINDAFDHHKRNIKKLKNKKWKFAGKDVGSWLVIGTLGISAAATGLLVCGLAAIVADQLLDAPKLKDIPKSIKDLAKESNDLKQSPVGLLFKTFKKAQL